MVAFFPYTYTRMDILIGCVALMSSTDSRAEALIRLKTATSGEYPWLGCFRSGAAPFPAEPSLAAAGPLILRHFEPEGTIP